MPTTETCKTIHYLPIEPIPSRYTEQMRRWVCQELDMLAEEGAISGYKVYEPEVEAAPICAGQFLDTYHTVVYKQSQLQMVVRAFESGEIVEGDVILCGDVWFTGLESLKMVAELSNVRVSIAGWHHAGVYDPHDYYTKNLSGWARSFETMLVNNVLDLMCCGSEFHKEFLVRGTGVDPKKVLPYGQVWNPSEVQQSVDAASKKQLVVFAHRLAPEKAPEHFIYAAAQVLRQLPKAEFVFSVPASSVPQHLVELNKELGYPCRFYHPTTKNDYYKLLANATVVYSSGYQETFGYSIHEGITLGCLPCFPDRACYLEAVAGETQYIYKSDDPYGSRKLVSLLSSEYKPDDKLLANESKLASNCRRFLSEVAKL